MPSYVGHSARRKQSLATLLPSSLHNLLSHMFLHRSRLLRVRSLGSNLLHHMFHSSFFSHRFHSSFLRRSLLRNDLLSSNLLRSNLSHRLLNRSLFRRSLCNWLLRSNLRHMLYRSSSLLHRSGLRSNRLRRSRRSLHSRSALHRLYWRGFLAGSCTLNRLHTILSRHNDNLLTALDRLGVLLRHTRPTQMHRRRRRGREKRPRTPPPP